MAGEPPELLIKYIYMKNLVVATLPKVRLLMPLDFPNIYPNTSSCAVIPHKTATTQGNVTIRIASTPPINLISSNLSLEMLPPAVVTLSVRTTPSDW
jgi:hypothetical protein